MDNITSTMRLIAIALAGAEEARQHQAEKQQNNQLYLIRLDLLPNPRANTPWQHMYAAQNWHAFITTTGPNCITFQYILDCGFKNLWNTAPIQRHNVHWCIRACVILSKLNNAQDQPPADLCPYSYHCVPIH